MDLGYLTIFCVLWYQIYDVYPRFIIPDLSGSGSGYLPPSDMPAASQTSMHQLEDITATPTGQFGELDVTSVYQESGVNRTGKPTRSPFSLAGPGSWLATSHTTTHNQPRGLTSRPLDQQINHPSLGEDASSGDYTTQDAPRPMSRLVEDGSGRHDDSATLG
ncbi:unnamed protein product [Arctogadus glacialis]